MADWREKIKTIASTKGASASESAKRAGMGCLAAFVSAVSILTFIIAIGLFRSGSWIMASFSTIFCIIAIATAVILLFPQKTNEL